MCQPTLRTSAHLSPDGLSLGLSSSVLQLPVSVSLPLIVFLFSLPFLSFPFLSFPFLSFLLSFPFLSFPFLSFSFANFFCFLSPSFFVHPHVSLHLFNCVERNSSVPVSKRNSSVSCGHVFEATRGKALRKVLGDVRSRRFGELARGDMPEAEDMAVIARHFEYRIVIKTTCGDSPLFCGVGSDAPRHWSLRLAPRNHGRERRPSPHTFRCCSWIPQQCSDQAPPGTLVPEPLPSVTCAFKPS